jgi:hypothetical protein
MREEIKKERKKEIVRENAAKQKPGTPNAKREFLKEKPQSDAYKSRSLYLKRVKAMTPF